MSTQLDFLMQLYMMNLLQQQQQQQQKLLQQQPQQAAAETTTSSSKIIAPAESTANTTTTTTQDDLQDSSDNSEEEEAEAETTTTKNSKKTRMKLNNCSSSSSSCSPNSKFSCNTDTIMTQENMLQQLLLNKLTPLNTNTKLNNLTNTNTNNLILPPSHVLLTPNTPNSNSNGVSVGDLVGSNSNITNLNLNQTNHLLQNLAQFSHLNQSHFSAEQFLQSSTVTSTPHTKLPLIDDEIVAHEEEEDEDDEDDDEKPLSSLYNSSDNATTSTAGTSGNGSGNGSAEIADSKMLMSGIQTLETTTDSMESLNMVSIKKKEKKNS